MKGIFIFFVALFSWVFLGLFGLIWDLAECIRYNKWRSVGDWFMNSAWGIDITANMTHQHFLNALFVKQGPDHFGVRGETISSKLGWLWITGKLTYMGESMTGYLNLVDEWHCWKYIERERYQHRGYPATMPVRPIAWYKTLTCIMILSAALFGPVWFWWGLAPALWVIAAFNAMNLYFALRPWRRKLYRWFRYQVLQVPLEKS
ncbi:hypothetical protein [Telluribacter humicola]|uniref:hypothetical protein n=1 Tax=Telluribacter humicola TaxID=1720261 RepID=UPI001A971D5B|nr:hypothetical protein [Telluribacter humicola]